MIEGYFQSILDLIAKSPIVHASNVLLDKRTTRIGLIRGELRFADGSVLLFRELVEVGTSVVRRMYSYHYQESDGLLVFRNDDTRHFPQLSNFPHHKHIGGEADVIATSAPNLAAVLREIEASYNLPNRS